MLTKIWYNVQNGGDGSAYPQFMESEILCEIDQKWMDEVWGESCVGNLVIESDNPIKIQGIITIDEQITEIEEELNQDYMKDYKKEGKYLDWFKRLEGKLAELKKLKENINA